MTGLYISHADMGLCDDVLSNIMDLAFRHALECPKMIAALGDPVHKLPYTFADNHWYATCPCGKQLNEKDWEWDEDFDEVYEKVDELIKEET